MGVTFADKDNSKIYNDEYTKHATYDGVVSKIKNAISSRKARTDEYFKDFDRLRTGFITKAQFNRCLDQHYGIVLGPAEDFIIVKKFGDNPKHPGMMNYRSFCKAVDVDCTEDNDLAKSAVTRPLSSSSLQRCKDLLERMAPYYKYHGISIKSSYADFDSHNIGLITESQFYRRFPGPPDISEKEQMLLLRKYLHPTKQGLCNYLDFHEDMEHIMRDEDSECFTEEPRKQETNLNTDKHDSEIESVFNKIREAVHKNGIRTTEFFKDHDKLRSGIVTKNQFVCGLSLCCGTQANLSRDEIDILVRYYQTEDGRVRYKEFCNLMENAFNVPHLEKNPTVDIPRPPIGALAKVPNNLGVVREGEVARIILELRETVRKKRIMLYPYFKDFDRGFGNTRGITKTQFSRMLHMVGLNIPHSDLEILCQKFEYPTSGDINYPAFVQAIDAEYCGRAAPSSSGGARTGSSSKTGDRESSDESPDISSVDIDELLKRIRHHVLVNRIRVEEFFQDFDPLRHGSIPTSRFRMGLSAMGQQHLTETQILAIIDRYADDTRKGNVWWISFFADIDKVFTQRGLEKTPTAVLPPAETYHMPKPGATDWTTVNKDKQMELDDVMQKMRLKTNQRRILAKPCFQDFDRHNIGYVTRSQLHQCLTYLSLNGTPAEVDLVYGKFSDDTGFNYLRFLEKLQPSEVQEQKYLKRIEELKLTNKEKAEWTVPKNIADVMQKIKTKVVKEAVRVYEFMKDYDKLRTGRMLKTSFPRALDLCALGLNYSEITTVMEWYSSPDHEGYVDYYRFCDDVESCFTQKGLEMNPTLVPTPFKPDPNLNIIKDLPEGEEMVEAVLHRLADRVRIRRIQLFPLFEDYDRVHNGTVSRSQLHRVLSELELGSLVSAREFHVLYEKFDIVIGGKHDFNYTQFCDVLNNYACFDPNIP